MTINEATTTQRWEVWYPKAGSTGILIARGELQPVDTLLVHAAGDLITAVVMEDGRELAMGQDLARTQPSPIARLRRIGDRITRDDIWPGEGDISSLVLLPGGEVGTLTAWWHADDRKEWRWQVEFYNSIR